MSASYLIVGLGNPGSKYVGTRHNVGRAVLKHFAQEHNVRLRGQEADVRYGAMRLAGEEVGLAVPNTYMNRSGIAVKGLLDIHRTPLDHLLIVMDDIHLDVGALRFRSSGGSGGHNGIQDVIDQVGTDAFLRMRIGIGTPPEEVDQVDYVLEPFSAEQQIVIDRTIEYGCQGIEVFIRRGIDTAMNQFNRQSAPGA